MIATIDQFDAKLPEIESVCRTNDVKRLDLFGSRARSDATNGSDIDFLVEFNDPLRPGVFDRFLSLRNSLERITGCRVDLVECSSIQNPVLRQRIDQDRRLVYAA
jgi:predicted nucleotidyltransferase